MRYRSERLRRRKERIDLLRDMLIGALGNICANWRDGCLTPGDSLEIDHVNGCTWVQRSVSSETRNIRYTREYREGVPLQVLCRACNGSKNQSVLGRRSERDLEPEPEPAPF